MHKILNFKKLIAKIWLVLWAILLILLILKFCFHQWYPIVINNQFIISICNWIDNHKIVLYLLEVLSTCIGGYFIICIATVNKKLSWTELIIVLPLCFAGSIIKNFYNGIGLIFDFITIVLIPIIINIKRKTFHKFFFNILFPILVNILLFVWQLSIFLIRDINNLLTQMPSLISLALQVDYYIFLIISYIGVCHMGAWGFWLWGKSITELEEIKAKELAKEQPDQDLIKKIDEIIAEEKEN